MIFGDYDSVLIINSFYFLEYLIVDFDVSSEERRLPLINGTKRISGTSNQIQITFDHIMPHVVLLEVQALKLGPSICLKVQLKDNNARRVSVANRKDQRLFHIFIEDKELAFVRKINQLL